MTKKELKAARARVERAYYKRCSGITINVMDIPKIFEAGVQIVAAGVDDAMLEDAVAAIVEKLRVEV
jgi:hypothetical protein